MAFKKVEFGWVGLNISRVSSVVSGPKFTSFSATWEKL